MSRFPSLARLVKLLRLAHSIQRQRSALLDLDDHLLDDIAVSRKAARAEGRRRVWDLPEAVRSRDEVGGSAERFGQSAPNTDPAPSAR
ncbi:DUF1127 domain-containing protein [Devosia pacifica]|uniref:DUF1127 domain-containing protein n=1 Tax=Devosia pacifica TaxID=1335967 RepID=UPI001AEDC802|nr:DUF1127 domain-containing protein [Devosia pacifica]